VQNQVTGSRTATYAAIRANLERRFGAGAWQGSPKDGVRCSFAELADRGQGKFEAGNYKRFA